MKEQNKMKKLMIAATIAFAAVVSQASQWSWTIASTDNVAYPGTTTDAAGTAYLYGGLTSTDYSAMVKAFAEGTFDPTAYGVYETTGYFMTDTVAGGVLSSTTVKSDKDPYSGIVKGDTVNWTMVILSKDPNSGDDIFFIDSMTAERAKDGSNKTVTFKEWDASTAAAMDAAGGYKTGGWYTAVPEPTSGLLLLLGVAGLALRRRRA